MRWVRTYTRSPEHTLGCGRAVVWDKAHCDPFYLDDLNYLPLFQAMTCDTTVIEWDMALAGGPAGVRGTRGGLAGPGAGGPATGTTRFDCEWGHRAPGRRTGVKGARTRRTSSGSG